MNERSHLETVRSVYERWARGDFGSIVVFDTEAELVLRGDFPDAGTYRGLDGIRTYMRGFLSPWERLTIEAEEIEAAGDRVLVRVRQRGTGGGSGVPTEMRYFHLWTFREDAVVRLESIRDEADARQAAGMTR
jgi:ketosteroid isomerase-like protein